jgi:hypothetical protein
LRFHRRGFIAETALLAFGMTIVAPASAQTAEHPQWRVGDKWVFEEVARFRDEKTKRSFLVVDSQPDGRFVIQTGAGGRVVFDQDGNSLDRRGPEFSWRRLAFPMAVGKRWSHERKTQSADSYGKETSSWSVVAWEKVTVPAGTFTCLRVEGTIFNSFEWDLSVSKGWQNGQTNTTYWYCPEVQWFGRTITESQAYMGAAWTRTETSLLVYTRKD